MEDGQMIEEGMMMTIIVVIAIITYISAISVAIVAFWNYWKIRNWKLFALAAAYSLLAAISIITPIVNMFFLNYNRQNDLYAVSSINSGLLLTAFALLAYVYYTERRACGIKIDKPHWFIGCLVVTPSIVSLIYFAIVTGLTFKISLGNTTIYYQTIPYLSGILIMMLQTYTIISLHSYYQNVKNRNTLIVMAGFIFLLLAYTASFLSPVLLLIMGDHVDVVAAVQSHSYIFLEDIVGLSLNLGGNVLFLVALLRLKRS
jgi:hypothetical protein